MEYELSKRGRWALVRSWDDCKDGAVCRVHEDVMLEDSETGELKVGPAAGMLFKAWGRPNGNTSSSMVVAEFHEMGGPVWWGSDKTAHKDDLDGTGCLLPVSVCEALYPGWGFNPLAAIPSMDTLGREEYQECTGPFQDR